MTRIQHVPEDFLVMTMGYAIESRDKAQKTWTYAVALANSPGASDRGQKQ
jgi:hypothetical protein